MEAMMDGVMAEVHMVVSRHPITSLPEDAGDLGSWLDERFDEKNRVISNFYSGGGLPEGRYFHPA